MAKKNRKTELTTARKPAAVTASKGLVKDVRRLIEAARRQTAQAVNATLVMMHWHIGRRIRQDVLKNDRAEYGKQILASLSRELTAEFGRGFGRRTLEQMVRFAEVFSDERIAQTLSAQLSWSHFVELIPVDDPLKREFYAEMCRAEGRREHVPHKGIAKRTEEPHAKARRRKGTRDDGK